MRIDYAYLPNDKFMVVFSELTEESFERINSRGEGRWQDFCEKTGACRVITTRDVVHFGEAPEEKAPAPLPPPEEMQERLDEAARRTGQQYMIEYPNGEKVYSQQASLTDWEVSPDVIQKVMGDLVPNYHEDTRLVGLLAKLFWAERFWEAGTPFEEALRHTWEQYARNKLKEAVEHAREAG